MDNLEDKDTYNNYEKLKAEGKYKKAYKCLESIVERDSDNHELVSEIAFFSLSHLRKIDITKLWFIKLMKLRSFWNDRLMMSRIEVELNDINSARRYLQKARKLEKKQRNFYNYDTERAKESFLETENFIRHKESFLSLEKKETLTKKKKTSQTPNSQNNTSTKTKPAPKTEESRRIKSVPTYKIPVSFKLPTKEELTLLPCTPSSVKDVRLLLDYVQLTLQGGFEELLCLNVIGGINKYWYQIETVKKVLKYFHGRVLLCDEVGLGKTIEAGMLLKEYIMRGMAKNILILTPPALVSQWKEEMEVKFGIEFVTTDDVDFTKNNETFWKQNFIIASLHTAKNKKNVELVKNEFYDIVVVDEAHHLRNRTTLSWKLVNQIQKRFIFLLTATPVQNNLIELYNLITLLRPGQFKTEKIFKEEYVKKGNMRTPVNRDKLKELLRDVMVRNTRSVIDLKLPNRFATTIKLEPSEIEHTIYKWLNDYLRKNKFRKNMVNLLLREAGSSPFALLKSLLKLPNSKERNEIIKVAKKLGDISKGKALIDIIRKNPQEKKIVFTQYIKSMEYITDLLSREKVIYTTFSGNMSTSEKNRAIACFKEDVPVLVSTESGGEGRNLQFCRTIVNFDLPWNPMKIEQRIGRLHRIGQTRDVFIFNLSVKGTIEDYIIDILDNKINMFEMVIGEIEPILGHVSKDDDFEQVIMNIWLKSESEKEMGNELEKLGDELIKAKNKYLKAKKLDEEIFGEDYET